MLMGFWETNGNEKTMILQGGRCRLVVDMQILELPRDNMNHGTVALMDRAQTVNGGKVDSTRDRAKEEQNGKNNKIRMLIGLAATKINKIKAGEPNSNTTIRIKMARNTSAKTPILTVGKTFSLDKIHGTSELKGNKSTLKKK